MNQSYILFQVLEHFYGPSIQTLQVYMEINRLYMTRDNSQFPLLIIDVFFLMNF